MEYSQYFDKETQMNVIDIKNLPLITFIGFYFNYPTFTSFFSPDSHIYYELKQKLINYYEETLEDTNKVGYYVNLVLNNLNSLTNVEIRWCDDDSYYQNLIMFNNNSLEDLIFDSIDLLKLDFIKQFV